MGSIDSFITRERLCLSVSRLRIAIEIQSQWSVPALSVLSSAEIDISVKHRRKMPPCAPPDTLAEPRATDGAAAGSRPRRCKRAGARALDNRCLG